MSTTSVTSSTSVATDPSIDDTTSSGTTLTNSDGTTQVTGLASGFNYDEIIQAELAQQEEPLTNMEDEITGLTTENSTLSDIQTDLQTVSLDAMELGEPSLFFDTQTVSSSDSTLVAATTTSGVGAVVGSATIAVSQLATAAQRTFDYTTPTADDTITIDGESVSLTSGETAQDFADAVNGDDSLDVWAAVTATSSGQEQIVLSSRDTGDNDDDADTYIDVQDNGTQVSGSDGSAGPVLTEVTADAQDGQDAAYSINGGATQYSASDTVTDALPDVTLTLSGVTGSTPVTITADQPAPSTSSVTSALQQFVTDYNTAVSAIESAINTAPTSESDSSDYNPNSGSLYGDDDLENFLAEMRETVDSTFGSGTYSTLTSIGLSTGASDGTPQTSSVDGDLTLDTTTLSDAITSDPSAVQTLLTTFATKFQSVVNAEAGSGGDISDRINGNDSLANSLQTQYTSMMQQYSTEEAEMEEQWAQVESTLETLDSQKSDLTDFADEATADDDTTSSS